VSPAPHAVGDVHGKKPEIMHVPLPQEASLVQKPLSSAQRLLQSMSS
jgi:hypothetical protein